MDYDIAINAIYVDGKAQDTFPKKDSGVKCSSIVCTNGTATFDEETWSVKLGELTEVSSCKIYFSSESIENPATGAFLNVLLMVLIVWASVYVIKRVINKYKFFKV